MLDQLLGDKADDIIKAVTSKLGVSDDQAGGFVQKLLSTVGDLMQGGKLDLGDIVKGNLGSLTSNLDMDSLGSMLGGGADKAEEGVNAAMGEVRNALDGDSDLLGSLTNALGGGGGADALKDAAGGMLGKLFGKG